MSITYVFLSLDVVLKLNRVRFLHRVLINFCFLTHSYWYFSITCLNFWLKVINITVIQPRGTIKSNIFINTIMNRELLLYLFNKYSVLRRSHLWWKNRKNSINIEKGKVRNKVRNVAVSLNISCNKIFD